MDGFINSPFVQLVGVFITALSGYLIAKFNRTGAKEANQTTGWANLVTALQKEIGDLRTQQNQEEVQNQIRYKELDLGNRELAKRVVRLERSRYRWKHWGQAIVPLLENTTLHFPPPPESLEDTDPGMESAK